MQASETDLLQEFHDAIQNPITRRSYENRLAQFLAKTGMGLTIPSQRSASQSFSISRIILDLDSIVLNQLLKFDDMTIILGRVFPSC